MSYLLLTFSVTGTSEPHPQCVIYAEVLTNESDTKYPKIRQTHRLSLNIQDSLEHILYIHYN